MLETMGTSQNHNSDFLSTEWFLNDDVVHIPYLKCTTLYNYITVFVLSKSTNTTNQ